MKKLMCIVSSVLFLMVCFAGSSAAIEIEPKPSFKVAGIIGASYEYGKAPDDHPNPNIAGNYMWGGIYKTWGDHIAAIQDIGGMSTSSFAKLNKSLLPIAAPLVDTNSYNWLNYALGGDISVNGIARLEKLIDATTPMGATETSLEVLVIGMWGNDFLWVPFSQEIVTTLIANVQAQINIAKANGVKKIIVTGFPDWNTIDLDEFIKFFPALTTHIDETGFKEVRRQYQAAFAIPNPDYVFVNPWCSDFKTVDYLHPYYGTSKKAAIRIWNAVVQYDYAVGNYNLTCDGPLSPIKP